EFTPEAAREAGWVLAAFALGTPAYVLARVLQPAFFAREDTKTPMRFTVASTLVNLVLVYPMFRWLGPTGCALATSIAGWVNLTLLSTGLRGEGFAKLVPGFISRVARIVVASVLMGAGIWFAGEWLKPWILTDGYVKRVLVLLGLVLFGVALYISAVFATRVYTIAELKSRLRRSPRT
ncbi:MAG: lipid II flippase MurJ, partial [Verrucomicrobiota bacterium]